LPSRPLTVLLISDGKPGHYRQAEGVVAALGRLRPVAVRRLEVRRRRLVPARALLGLANRYASPPLLLWLGYGLRQSALPGADIVVSAGGETLAVNVAAAQLLGCPNIFCGRLRRLAPEHVALVLVSLEDLAVSPNYLVVLPPSATDIERKLPEAGAARFGRTNPPRTVGLLVGGNSGALQYGEEDWVALTGFMEEAHRACGLRWIATTSRRSGAAIGDRLAAMARAPGSGLDRFIDYRTAEPGSIAEVLSAADVVLCTDDSTSMIAEAIGACLPVVALVPGRGAHEPREAEFRRMLARHGWYRALPRARLTPEAFLRALEDITPRATNQLDELGARLRERLPEVLGGGAPPARSQ
jgi:mitochondrial fission protein ELM1